MIFAVAILGFFLSGCNTLDGVEEISIIEDKNRTSEEFDYKWYQVELIYQSGKTKLIPLTESMIREYDRLLFYKAGTHTIHVDTYKRTATFEITVAMNSFGDDINDCFRQIVRRSCVRPWCIW